MGSHLLDNGGITMNDLARMEFTRDDRAQFAQLIGYSHDGSSALGYVSDEVWETALATYQTDKSEHEARADVLRCQLAEARKGMRAGVAALFNLRPDDLDPQP